MQAFLNKRLGMEENFFDFQKHLKTITYVVVAIFCKRFDILCTWLKLKIRLKVFLGRKKISFLTQLP